jgi:hypothetical protein
MRTVFVLVLFLAVLQAPSSLSQEAAAPEPSADAPPTTEYLEGLVGSIALYPDPVVAQVLPASTYPMEIVQAARWAEGKQELAKANPDAFQKELEAQKWDPTVKAVTNIPDALAKLNGDLDWTNALGEAYLGYPKETMDAIQRLRAKAQNNGVLTDTPQQVILVEKETIRIEPADPEIIYVPQYNPQVVYVQQPAAQPVVVQQPATTTVVHWAALLWRGYGRRRGVFQRLRLVWRGLLWARLPALWILSKRACCQL